MNFRRLLLAGLIVSVLAHGAGSAIFSEDPNDIEIAASKGGGVSVIGSIEDLVAGSKVDAVEPNKPAEEIEPIEEPLEPVRDLVTAKPVETPVQVEVKQPVKAVQQISNVYAAAAAVTAPAVRGITSTETVPASKTLPVDRPNESQPVVEAKQEQPISDAEPVKLVEAKPLELAKAVQPNMQKTMAVDTIVETTPPEPISEVIKAPAKKPETPIKKTNQFKKKKKKASRTAQKKGAETNTRKGGERITSQTARSNANGQANAKTNDGGTKARSNYKGKVVAKLRRAKRYPKQARREKLTGSVRVTFTISKNGSVSGVRVSRSSGHPILDKAALDMVRRASPMPKFPKDMKRTRMSLHVPVQFSR